MSVHPAKMVAIWDKRIQLVRDRIQALRSIGITYDDDDLRELYERLKYMEDCRKIAQKNVAWMEA